MSTVAYGEISCDWVVGNRIRSNMQWVLAGDRCRKDWVFANPRWWWCSCLFFHFQSSSESFTNCLLDIYVHLDVPCPTQNQCVVKLIYPIHIKPPVTCLSSGAPQLGQWGQPPLPPARSCSYLIPPFLNSQVHPVITSLSWISKISQSAPLCTVRTAPA